mgnify:CR=1 FL=1
MSFVVGHYLIQYIFKLYILMVVQLLLLLILSLVCSGVGGEGYGVGAVGGLADRGSRGAGPGAGQAGWACGAIDSGHTRARARLGRPHSAVAPDRWSARGLVRRHGAPRRQDHRSRCELAAQVPALRAIQDGQPVGWPWAQRARGGWRGLGPGGAGRVEVGLGVPRSGELLGPGPRGCNLFPRRR